MKKQFNFLILLFLIFNMISCQKEINQDDVIRIVSPVSGWTYYEDNKIHFTTNVDTDNINWYSTKDGFLGNKNGLK